ncbi:DUF456 family protein, partial [Staphylococcus aureus]|uniref:DUF456 family protein n=1 Tax=Staphylococcus aureus TaxID=1280 RepID=UPI001F5BA499
IIIIPFILVFIVELIQGYSFERAVKVSIGSIVAFLTSSIAQAIIMFIMIVWFFIVFFIPQSLLAFGPYIQVSNWVFIIFSFIVMPIGLRIERNISKKHSHTFL